ncbi:MAG TPA: DUF6443 domain-containing protein [Edaphocola sp.]|nr:DUF6443 domain-containing protein [Edaphocola sp.]
MKNLSFSSFILLYLLLPGLQTFAQQVSPGANIPATVTTPPAVTNWPGIYNGSNTDQNYVREQTPDQPGTSFNALGFYRQTTQYFDGLGRPLQTVSKKAQADGYDLVQSFIYDASGRQSYRYLPYAFPTLAGATGNYHYNMKSDIQNFYAGSTGEEPYAQTVYDNSPLNRPVQQLSPGHGWVGSHRGKTFDYNTNRDISYLVNGASPQYYNVTGSWPRYTLGSAATALPQYAGDYSEGTLYITRTTDEDGKMSEEAKDKLGRVVFTRTLAQKVTGTQYPAGVPADVFTVNWAYTVYIYDDLGRLRYVLPPEAAKAALANYQVVNAGAYTNHNYTYAFPNITQAISDGLCYKYTYDERSRLVEKKLPGKAVEYFVYDKRDRQVMYQDGNLRAGGSWAFTIYDAMDRPMVTGRVQSTAADRSTIQNVINNGTAYAAPSLYYYLKNYSLWHVYPASVTTSPGAGTILSYIYYDDYGNNAFSGFSFDNSQFPSYSAATVVPSVKAAKVMGRVTGTKLRVLDPDNPTANNWLMTVNYYDDNGRIIQSQGQNLEGGIDITSNLYYFQGELYKTVTDHHNPDAKPVPGATDVLTEITLEKTYDRNFANGGGNDLVGQVRQSINGGVPYDLAAYSYDHLDRLVTKELTVGNVHHKYNVRGFLNEIVAGSNDTLTAWGVPIPFTKIYFEEHLFYDQGFKSRLYNGNVAGITWQGMHALGSVGNENAYGYSYDLMNRLSYAEYRRNESATQGSYDWGKDDYDYTVSNIGYDLDGNLKRMDQRGVTTQPIDMDQLTYTYAAGSNQLVKVKDAVAPANTTGLPDFKDSADLATEYAYDANGNLVSDANKKITSITYNFLNKPEKITVNGQGAITYVYDASGNRLEKRIRTSGGATTTYDYIGNFVYKNDVLQYILNEEGRCRPVATDSTFGLTRFVYDYFIKDHLGNVRSVVTASPVSPQYLAKHEIASANVEQLFFDNIPAVRSAKPGSTDPDDQMAAQLVAGDPDRQVGTAIMLRVMPGDRFDISADAHYEGQFRDEGSVDAGSIVSSLLSTLTGGMNYDGIPLSELPENARIIEQTVGNPAMAEQLNNLLNQHDDPELPKAHLNYLVFNDEMQLVPQESGAVQVPITANNGWATLTPIGQVTTTHSGYILVYIDNQSIGNDVWFDNVHLEHYTGQVLEEDMYYPFGLTMSAISSQAFGGIENKYRYNGKELQDDLGLNWYDYGARQYDMQIGRWTSIDALATKMPAYSPYSYAFDNPVKFIDIGGLIPYPITIRAFAPFEAFGFGYHGDNRGYSTSSSVTARVNQRINFDTDKRSITTKAWSNPSWKVDDPSHKATATPSVKFDEPFAISKNGGSRTFTFGSHVAAGNPKTPKRFTPNIDVFSDFSITENKKAGTLSISGKLTGDNFPSTEAFITDPNGNNVFIGVGQIAKGVGKNTGPFTELWGENEDRPVTSFNFTITTDKKGNFTGVKVGDTNYTIQQWNKLFTSQSPQAK